MDKTFLNTDALLSPWSIIYHLQKRDLLQRIFDRVSEDIVFLNIASGLSYLGFDFIQSNKISVAINTDISKVSENFHHALKKKLSSTDRRYRYKSYDVFNQDSLSTGDTVNVAFLSGFLSRYDLKAAINVLSKIHSSVAWSQKEAYLAVHNPNFEKLPVELEVMFELVDVYTYTISQNSFVMDKIKHIVKRILRPKVKTNNVLQNLSVNDTDSISLDKSRANPPKNVIVRFFIRLLNKLQFNAINRNVESYFNYTTDFPVHVEDQSVYYNTYYLLKLK